MCTWQKTTLFSSPAQLLPFLHTMGRKNAITKRSCPRRSFQITNHLTTAPYTRFYPLPRRRTSVLLLVLGFNRWIPENTENVYLAPCFGCIQYPILFSSVAGLCFARTAVLLIVSSNSFEQVTGTARLLLVRDRKPLLARQGLLQLFQATQSDSNANPIPNPHPKKTTQPPGDRSSPVPPGVMMI